MHHFTSHHMLSSHKGSVRATLCIILYRNYIGVTQQTSVIKPYAQSFGNMRNQLPRPTELFCFMWNFCSLRQFYPKRKNVTEVEMSPYIKDTGCQIAPILYPSI